MRNRTRELLDYLDRERAALRAAAESVPAHRHAMSPESEQWSVLQILDHLRIIEGQIAGLFMKMTAEARASGQPAETDDSPILDAAFLDRVLDRGGRLQSPKSGLPQAPADFVAAWQGLEQSRATMRAAITAMDGLALAQFSYPHLYFGPLNFYQWIGFVGAHEARHAAQIREVGARLSGAD